MAPHLCFLLAVTLRTATKLYYAYPVYDRSQKIDVSVKNRRVNLLVIPRIRFNNYFIFN